MGGKKKPNKSKTSVSPVNAQHPGMDKEQVQAGRKLARRHRDILVTLAK